MKVIKEYIEILKDDLNNNKWYKHIPNLLTFLRFLSPFFIIPLMLFNNYKYAFIVVMFAAITDIFDGLIARKYNFTSEFGRLLDAVTDKFFSLSLLVFIVKINKIYIVVILLELLIGCSNYIAYKRNKKPQTHSVGKIKTIVQFAFLTLCYLSFVIDINIDILNGVFLINIVLELISLFLYIIKNK